MNKLMLYSLALVTMIASCTKKTDTVFEQTVDERLTETINGFQNHLTAAPGWKLFVYPKGLESQGIPIGGFSYYLRFANNNRVTMVSDFDIAVSATPKESGYRLKALQRPSLIFDTYTYMHLPADPDPSVSLSPTNAGGFGQGSDFNFSFTTNTPKDTLNLEGNFNNSAAVLVKATQAEMDAAFARGRLRDIMNFTSSYLTNNPYLYFQASSTLRVSVGFNLDNSILSFPYNAGGNLINTSSPFSYTTYGVHLMSPLTIGNYTFQDFYWDDTRKIYYIMSGTTRVDFVSSPSPVFTLSLSNVIGGQFTTISVPAGAGLRNTSQLFLSKYKAANDALLAGPYGLSLGDMDFIFNAQAKSMELDVSVFQGTTGPFLCQYLYSYTVDASGFYKFNKVGQNGNAALIVSEMSPLLSNIENEQFRLDGQSTSSSFLGQFTSRQTPAFFFSGYLF